MNEIVGLDLKIGKTQCKTIEYSRKQHTPQKHSFTTTAEPYYLANQLWAEITRENSALGLQTTATAQTGCP